MLKKVISIAVAIALCGSLLAGCGSKTASNDTAVTPAESTAEAAPAATETEPAEPVVSGDITLFSNMTNWANDFYPALVKAFNQKYPEVKVTVDTNTQYDDTLKIKMSSGDMPDVFSSFVNNPSPKQRQEYCMPLDEMPVAADIDEAFKAFFKGEDGKVYGLPYGKSISGIVIYNKKVFKDNGIEIPKTLDELIAAGQKIQAAPDMIAGLTMPVKDQWTMCQYDEDIPRYFSADPDVFNKLDVGSDTPFTIDGPWGQAFKLIAQLRDSGIIGKSPASYGWETMKTDFKAGKVGMIFLSGWFVNQAVTEDIANAGQAGQYVGIFPMPFDNSGKLFAAYSPLPGFSIAKSTKSPEASQAFVTYMLSDYNDILNMKQGSFSTNKNVTIKYDWAEGLQAEQMVESPKSADVTNIWQGGNVDFSGKASAVVVGGTPEKAIEDMNNSWANGRKVSK